MENERNIGRFTTLLATIILLTGIASTIYVESLKEEKQTDNVIHINEIDYEIEDIFVDFIEISIEEFSGILLSDLLNDTSLINPEDYHYKVIGEDGYAKTIEWKHMKKGILTREKNVVFENLPQQFWIKDIAQIEVT